MLRAGVTLRTAIAAALVSRAIVIGAAAAAHGPAAFVAPDTGTYVARAASLATARAFTDAAGQPEVFRTPGYPLVLVPGVVAGHPVLYALALNLALAAALVALTFRLVRAAGGSDRAAGLGGLAVALEPATLLWSVKAMPETLFTVLLAGSVLATAQALAAEDARASAGGAVLLAAATYVKPIAYPFAALVSVASFVCYARGGWRQRHLLVFPLVCAALLTPWHVRNARVAGFTGFSTLPAHAVYVSAGGSVAARQAGEPYADVRRRLLSRAREEPGATRYGTMWREGWAMLRADAGGYTVTHAAGVARTMFDPGAVEYLRLVGRYPEDGGALSRAIDRGLFGGARDWAARHPAAFWASVLLAPVPIALAALAAIAAARRRAWRARAFTLSALAAAYLLVAGGGVPGSSRFRVPATPLLIAMGSVACAARRPLRGSGAPHTLAR